MNLNISKSKPVQGNCQGNYYHVSDKVNVDVIIEYTVTSNEIGNNDDNDAKVLENMGY
jgi:hypothetical protein